MAIRNTWPTCWTFPIRDFTWWQNGRQLRSFRNVLDYNEIESGGGPNGSNRIRLRNTNNNPVDRVYWLADDQSALDRCWVCFYHLVQAGSYRPIRVQSSTGGAIFDLDVNALDGSVSVRDAATGQNVIVTPDGVIYANSWTHFAMDLDIDNGATIRLLLNGRDEFAGTVPTHGPGRAQMQRVMLNETESANIENTRYAAALTGDWDPDGRAFKALNPGELPPSPLNLDLDPNADGAINGWTPSTGSTAWEVLNGASAYSVDNSYIGVDVPGAIQEVALQDLIDVGLEDVEVLAVAVQAVARKTGGGSAGLRINLTDGTNVVVGTDRTLVDGTIKGILEVYETAPDGTALSTAQVDGLRVQVESLL